jgi:hypothetical protein
MPNGNGPTRKLIEFDAESWQAIMGLSRDSMKSLQELMDEAVRDLLTKYNRPTTLKEMLQASARTVPANDVASKPRKPIKKKPSLP